VSRYGWPTARRPRTRDRVAQRMAFNASRDAGLDPEALDEARIMRRLHEAAAATAFAHVGVIAFAPTGPAEAWLPIGPTTTVRGPAETEPRVAGRIRDIAISPDGRRIYAASALGGLWYSEDAGATWEPVGGFASTRDRAAITAASNTMACGAVHVRFAPPATPDPHTVDEVWVGTGEPNPLGQPTDFGNLGYYGGVGVLHRVGPVGLSRAGDPDPWEADRQAQPRAAPTAYAGLRGAGVFEFAADPAEPRRLVAATTRGLHVHDPAATAPTDPWSVVADPTWDARPGSPGSANLVVTDVAWVRGAAPGTSRLWVAIRQDGTALTGLWRSDNGVAGPFQEVILPGARTGAGGAAVRRLAIAVAPSDPDVLYVLGSGPAMWRVDGAATVRRVTGLPAGLFGAGDASHYDLAIAIDPASPRRFLIGGAAVTGPDDNLPAAALYRLTVPAAPPAAGAAWVTDYVGGDAADATWIGAATHADVQRIRWHDDGAANPVFVATDGGIYVSDQSATRGTLAPRTNGMAVSEPGFIAAHGDTDGAVLIGCQDNGAQLRLGGAWRRVIQVGDGGGVAFAPGLRGRFLAQQTQSTWVADNQEITPTLRAAFNPAAPAQQNEHAASRFYSNGAARRRADGVTQLAIGTNRVWYSERWGRSQWDGVAGVFRRSWVTLPTGGDPRAGDAQDTVTDVIPPGPFPAGTVDNSGGIRVLRWATDHRLYVLMPGSVHRLDRSPATMRFARTQIHARPAMPAVGGPPAPAAGPNLPPDGTLNDLAVHEPGAGAHGSFYLATSHPTEPVWWFDGTATWHPTGLGTLPPPAPAPPGAPDGVRAPAYAIAVDPDNRTIVYAGTAVGVWRGELTPAAGGNPPQWQWRSFNNGLPEAAVQDLTIDSWPRPGGGARLRLMRAALQARGAWELDLDDVADDLTYIRCNAYDTRRRFPAPATDPLFQVAAPDADWTLDWGLRRNRDHRTAAGQPAPHPDGTPAADMLWHASPDIRLRPAPGAPLPAPASLPWVASPADRFELWAVQTALHGLDERIVPDGRWTAWFGRRVSAIRTARGLGAAARIDAALWNHADVQNAFWTDPWDAGGPGEADLVERIVGMPTPRPGGVAARARSAASAALPAGFAQVDVAVHRRSITAAPAGDIAVLLLRLPLPGAAATWGAIAAPALDGLEGAMENASAGGGQLPATVALPAGWDAPDLAAEIRRPRRAARTAEATVVTFQVSFVPGTFLLLALVHHGPLTPSFPAGAATLRALVERSPHVAARSVLIV
jgi:hypothetical protein